MLTDTERKQLVVLMRDAIASANNAWSIRELYEDDANTAIDAALAAGWRFLPPVDGR